MPHSTIQQPADASLIGSVDYQRRTAIAQVAIVEKSAGRRARIGASIDGVMPLATDYPRVVLQAEPYVKGVRDLLRDPDGRGALVATKTSEWQISDINVSGKPSTLTLRFFEGIATDPSTDGIPFVIDKDFDKLSRITVRVIFVPDAPNLPKRQLEVWYDGVKVGTKDLPASDSFHGWLRLILKTGGDDPASMSFANIGSQKSDNVGQSLLILAPDNDEWKPGLSKPLTATISTPRVGYLDFDRWFANGDLFRKAFGKDREDTTDNPGAVFMNGLAAAYAMRKFDAKLARELERLPDPAVEKIRLELSVLDHLKQTTPTSVRAQLHDLEGRLLGVATKFAADAKGVKLRPPAWFLEHLFKPLDEAFRFDLTLKPGPLALEPMNRPRDMQRTASVPAGMVARLSMDTMVRAEHFEKSAKGHPSVFHRGLLQYASRHVFDTNSEALPPTHVIFPAAALLIETMYDGIEEVAAPIEYGDGKGAIALAEALISAQTIERARRFDLVAGEPKSADLRQKSCLLGEIDVVSQRWRPSGRPIYHLVNPREFALDDPDKKAVTSARTHPALPLALDEAGKLAQFELEAFFNRSDVDFPNGDAAPVAAAWHDHTPGTSLESGIGDLLPAPLHAAVALCRCAAQAEETRGQCLAHRQAKSSVDDQRTWLDDARGHAGGPRANSAHKTATEGADSPDDRAGGRWHRPAGAAGCGNTAGPPFARGGLRRSHRDRDQDRIRLRLCEARRTPR